MYAPSEAEEYERLGFDPEDYDAGPFEVWPENGPSFNVFADMQTQWRVSVDGRTGLDYLALVTVMDFHGVATEDRRQMFADVQVMELAALTQMNKKQ